jgi:hypothetical protein
MAKGGLMVIWLFDSIGNPIAFAIENAVWSIKGRYIGYIMGKEVWNGEYLGEIVHGNRMLYNRLAIHTSKGQRIMLPPPAIPITPISEASISIPGGYEDVNIS